MFERSGKLLDPKPRRGQTGTADPFDDSIVYSRPPACRQLRIREIQCSGCTAGAVRYAFPRGPVGTMGNEPCWTIASPRPRLRNNSVGQTARSTVRSLTSPPHCCGRRSRYAETPRHTAGEVRDAFPQGAEGRRSEGKRQPVLYKAAPRRGKQTLSSDILTAGANRPILSKIPLTAR